MERPSWLQTGLLVHYPPQNLFFHAAYVGQDDEGNLQKTIYTKEPHTHLNNHQNKASFVN
jgi:hypothetical protein